MVKPKCVFLEMENGRGFYERVLGDQCDLHFFPDSLNKRVKEAQDADIISVFIRSRVDEDTISKLKNVKLIATRSTGVDHIDVKAAGEKGVTISNVPFYGENTVAEHTFALILALSRNIHRAYVRTLRDDFSWEGLAGFDLKGKTLGVVGAGHIGLYVIKMAKGFGMNVLAFDMKKDPFVAEILGFKYADFDWLLQNSDIVTLHVPYIKATHHLMNRETIAKMKKGSILINTARGGLVDSEALVWALDQKILAGAGLDVLEGEELIKEEIEIMSSEYDREVLAHLVRNHILMRREDVVITPHIAFNSREAIKRIAETTAENINRFILNIPQNEVSIPQRKAA